MQALYLASDAPAGKTALAAALGKRFQARGKRLGYVKLVANPSETDRQDGDVLFLRQALGLGDAEAVAVAPPQAAAQRSRFQSRDLVILEGPLQPEVARAWEARVLLVLTPAQARAWSTPGGGTDRFLGAVINQVPGNGFAGLTAALREKGLRVLGQLPEERLLRAPSVADLARWFQGKILNREDAGDALVEHFLVGVLRPDSTLPYFQSRPAKAVITRGNRPDIQLAALETDTRCLLLTGGTMPLPIVLRRAVERGIPLIQVEPTTKKVTEALGPALSELRFHHPAKLECLQALLEAHLDLAALDQALGA